MGLLRKLIAIWIVVLVVLPFTTPFAICDLDALMGEAAPIVPHDACGGHTVPASALRGERTPWPGPLPSSERFTRDDAVPRAIASPTRGFRLVSSGRVPLTASATSSSTATALSGLALVACQRERTVRSTVLRI